MPSKRISSATITVTESSSRRLPSLQEHCIAAIGSARTAQRTRSGMRQPKLTPSASALPGTLLNRRDNVSPDFCAERFSNPHTFSECSNPSNPAVGDPPTGSNVYSAGHQDPRGSENSKALCAEVRAHLRRGPAAGVPGRSACSVGEIIRSRCTLFAGRLL